MVQTDALDLARHAVQLEAAFLADLHGAQAHLDSLFVNGLALTVERCPQRVEIGRLGTPQVGLGYAKRRRCLAITHGCVVG